FITDDVQKPGAGSSESDSESSSGESEPTSTYTSSKTWMNYSEILEDDESGDPEISTEFSNMTMISAALRERSILNCPQRCGRYFRNATRAYKHIKECKGKSEKQRCKLCGKILQSKDGIKHHIISKHRKVSCVFHSLLYCST
ncbi:---NA---, partial [Paramuricea clavata]